MPHTVLIADDNERIRARLRSFLEGVGWIVAEAANGAEAIQKSTELKPALVILNLSMPVLDGFQALPEIRAVSPPPKVIIFTLHEGEAFRQKAKELGAHAFVVKSQPLDDLLAEAKKLLAIPN